MPRQTGLGMHTSSMWSSGGIFLSNVRFNFPNTSMRYDSSSISFFSRFSLSQPTPSPANTWLIISLRNAWLSELLDERSAFCCRWSSSWVCFGPECLISGDRSTSALRPGNVSKGILLVFWRCCCTFWLGRCWLLYGCDCCLSINFNNNDDSAFLQDNYIDQLIIFTFAKQIRKHRRCWRCDTIHFATERWQKITTGEETTRTMADHRIAWLRTVLFWHLRLWMLL